MADQSEQTQNPWLGGEESARVEMDHTVSLMTEKVEIEAPNSNLIQNPIANSDGELGVIERAFSAAGAAFLSAVLVNPLDVAKFFDCPDYPPFTFVPKLTMRVIFVLHQPYNLPVSTTRLQAQAAGVPYAHPLSNLTSRMAFFGPTMMFADLRCSPTCSRAGVQGTVAICPPDCFQYKGTLDVFYKIVQQEGVARLWRGTNAGLALAVPTVGIYLPCYDIFRNYLEGFLSQNIPSMTPYAPLLAGSLARSLACTTCYPIELARTRMQAFKEINTGKKPPGVTKTLVEVLSRVKSTNGLTNLQNYRALWTGLGAQLARDVPYSAICWSTLEPLRRRLLSLTGDRSNAATVFGANFSAGFVAGSIAAAATCPLDVAKTRRQIEKDPVRAWRMTTRQTLMQVYRDGGMKGLFTGVGPRVGRAGPSVGIVVSFYEVVKYALHHHYATS